VSVARPFFFETAFRKKTVTKKSFVFGSWRSHDEELFETLKVVPPRLTKFYRKRKRAEIVQTPREYETFDVLKFKNFKKFSAPRSGRFFLPSFGCF